MSSAADDPNLNPLPGESRDEELRQQAPAENPPVAGVVWERPGSGPHRSGKWDPPTLEFMQGMLPPYAFISLLGRGGMGAVYKAVQISLDRPVAIKVLPADIMDDVDSNFMERFKNEARTMARMNHPGIVNVYDFGVAPGGLLYFVMEYVNGTDVAKMVQGSGKLPPEHALAITAHVCDALQYAHDRGVVHRDIKPANVLINLEGQVKVADFGLAKAADMPGSSGLTKSNMTMGTPDYVAPEALVTGMSADHRADLYAMGVMLYNMLTGEIPRGFFKVPSERVGSDPRYDGIIRRAMESDRDQRYQNAMELRRDLDVILTTPIAKPEPEPAPRQAGPGRSKPAMRRPERQEEEVYHPPAANKKSDHGMLWLVFSIVTALAVAAYFFFQKPAPGPSASSTPSELAGGSGQVSHASSQPPGPWVDALAEIHLPQDVIDPAKAESFQRSGHDLVFADAHTAMLALRTVPSGAYEFRAEVIPQFSNGGYVMWWLPILPEGKFVAFKMEANRLRLVHAEPPQALEPNPVHNGDKHTFTVRIEPDGDKVQATLLVDDNVLLTRRLVPLQDISSNWGKTPARRIFLAGDVYGSGNRLIVRRMELRSLHGGSLEEQGTLSSSTATVAPSNAKPAGENIPVAAAPAVRAAFSPRSDGLVWKDRFADSASWPKYRGWMQDGTGRYVTGCCGLCTIPETTANTAIRIRFLREEVKVFVALGLHNGSPSEYGPRHASVYLANTFFDVDGAANSSVSYSPMTKEGEPFQGRGLGSTLETKSGDVEHTGEFYIEGGNLSYYFDGRLVTAAYDTTLPEKGTSTVYVGSGLHLLSVETAELGAGLTEIPPASSEGVDLIKTVDLERDVVKGIWKTGDRGLETEHAGGVPKILEFQEKAPDEYDLIVDFTPTSDGNNVNLHLSAQGRSFAWKMSEGNIFGFESLDGHALTVGQETVREADNNNLKRLKTGQRCVTEVQVRKGELRALLDGREIIHWRGDFSRLSMDPQFRLPSPGRLGVGSWDRGVIFHSVILRPVSAVITAASSPPVSNQNLPGSDPRLLQLETGFKARYESDAQQPYAAAVAALDQSYLVNGIARARAEAQRSGLVTRVAALDDERMRVKNHEPLPATDASSLPLDLLRLRATYRQVLAKIEADRSKKARELYNMYLTALDDYAAELTKAGDRQAARKVETWRNEIAARKAALPEDVDLNTDSAGRGKS